MSSPAFHSRALRMLRKGGNVAIAACRLESGHVGKSSFDDADTSATHPVIDSLHKDPSPPPPPPPKADALDRIAAARQAHMPPDGDSELPSTNVPRLSETSLSELSSPSVVELKGEAMQGRVFGEAAGGVPRLSRSSTHTLLKASCQSNERSSELGADTGWQPSSNKVTPIKRAAASKGIPVRPKHSPSATFVPNRRSIDNTEGVHSSRKTPHVCINIDESAIQPARTVQSGDPTPNPSTSTSTASDPSSTESISPEQQAAESHPPQQPRAAHVPHREADVLASLSRKRPQQRQRPTQRLEGLDPIAAAGEAHMPPDKDSVPSTKVTRLPRLPPPIPPPARPLPGPPPLPRAVDLVSHLSQARGDVARYDSALARARHHNATVEPADALTAAARAADAAVEMLADASESAARFVADTAGFRVRTRRAADGELCVLPDMRRKALRNGPGRPASPGGRPNRQAPTAVPDRCQRPVPNAGVERTLFSRC